MITPEKLYNATDCGLKIIALHFPQVEEAARNNKPFKMRDGERTPSARVKLYRTKEGCDVWKVTDFGGDGHAMDPIAIHMDQTGLRFAEAVLDLAQTFGVTNELNRAINKPDIRKVAAKEDQKEGECQWDITQEFTEEQCKVMGPRVKPEHLQSLHWYSVNWISHVKNREVVYKYANEHYPIFMRECWFVDQDGKRDRFYKIYEPLNPEKQWRFSYQPTNKKPKSYINGLDELAAAWRDYNEKEERAWNTDPANENKPYKEKKLPEAVICSGERDALCVRSLGYHPLWFNSETYKVSEEEYKQIMRYVETLYNIPDIDTTGKIKGTELALKFIDIHTIWLPKWLSKYHDNRGKPRKDFRDFMELRKENADFAALLRLANPAKFWKVSISEKTGQKRFTIDVECLYTFLNLNGFFSLKDEKSVNARLIRIEGNIVRDVTPKEIRAFVHEWATETAQVRELRNLILCTPTLSAGSLEALKEVDLDFTNYTESSQWFYFPTFSLEVTGYGIKKHDAKTANNGRYVWEKNVIKHNIRLCDDMFTISHPEGYTRSEDFDISINNLDSSYFRYLINSSRLYWRKELEGNFEGRTGKEREEYKSAHKFDIAGEGLTEDEIKEQKQCLINKIFTIGYIMHRFKSPSRPWAPFVMDNVIGEREQCNGGSGKTFMFMALANFIRYVKLSGKNTELLKNPHAFEQIDKYTDMVLVDDCDEYFPFKQFYDVITSGITIDAKFVSAYTLSYEEAPKWVFTTNYVPKEFEGSSARRMLYVVVSDYYHQSSEDNDYLETRTIRDDFNKDLFSSQYTEAEWEADINFIMQCVRFYLSVAHSNIKIEPRLTNIIFRKYLNDMSDNFKEWAEYYFAPGPDSNLDKMIIREDAFSAFKQFSGVSKITMQKFSKSLKAFCYVCDYVEELNPEEFWNSGSRILKRIENPITHKMETKEMIYLRSVHVPQPPTPVQEVLPF